MSQRYRYLFLLLICSLSTLSGWGQRTISPRIYVRTEVHPDHVLLRWIASDARSWQLLNKYGVQLERLTVARGGELLDQPEVKLLASQLKPKESDQLKTLAGAYPMGAVIAQAIFGESFEVSLGNSPISRAIALDEDRQQRYLFALYAADLCFPVAKEVGWGFEDKSVQAGERYLYRVRSLVPERELRIEVGASFVVAGDTMRLPQPLELSAQFGPSGAYLRWDYDRLSSLYAAYWLERSEDGLSFSRISELPITRMGDTEGDSHAPITYLDSIPYRKVYYYRVAGVTPFGSQGAYSAVVSGSAYPPLTASPQIRDYHLDGQGGAKLSWDFKAEEEDLIEGFRILRSREDKHYLPYDSVSAQQRIYSITTLGRYPYYKVEAKAKQGSSRSALPLLIQAIDSIPPAIPKGLRADVDSLGAVHLSWQAGEDEDLHGYRLYRGETQGEELIPITSEAITATSYTDSVRLDNLNAEVYYALTALDERYNQSELSPVVVARKPSRIPPAMPLIVEVQATEEGNLIRWEQGHDPYLAGFVITRTEEQDTTQRVTRRIEDTSANSYMDKEITRGKAYSYQLTAYTTSTTSGVYSPTSPVMKIISSRAKTDTKTMNFSINIQPEGIALRWRTSPHRLVTITLYKRDSTGKMSLYQENLPAEGDLVDTDIYQGKKNEYMIVVKRRGDRPISIRKEVLL